MIPFRHLTTPSISTIISKRYEHRTSKCTPSPSQMLRKFSTKLSTRHSTDSPTRSSRSSQEASHSSAQNPHSSYVYTQALEPSIYNSRRSAQTPRTSDQPLYLTTNASPHTSDQAPYYTFLTHRSSAQTRKSQTPTSRSSASAPHNTTKHPFSLPPTTPHDHVAWAEHDDLLHSLTVRASDLEQLAIAAEARWKAAEALLCPSEHHTIGRAANIPHVTRYSPVASAY
jgi:hypothetical protein